MTTVSDAAPATPPGATSTASQRDGKGRFAKGNKGGPGCPFNRRVAALRKLLVECVSDDDLTAIVDRLVAQAKEGDMAAIKLVLAYSIGKPTTAVDPDRVDVDEFKLYCEETLDTDTATLPLKGVPAGVACEMVGAALPGLSDHIAQELGEALAAEQDEDDEEDDDDEPVAQPSPQRQSPPAPELLSLDEIRALRRPPDELPALLDALRQQAREAASMKDNTDSKRVETEGRAANPRQ
jgi:hypothetical protein